MKQIWFDTETTGLDPVKHDVIQIAGKIIIDNKDMESFNLVCQPHSFENATAEALKVNGRTIEEIKTFPAPSEVYKELSDIFGRYVDKYDKQDKFIACGQNIKFDIGMMGEFWKKCGDNYFFSFINPVSLDTMQLAVMLEMKQGSKIFNSYKLENLYKTLFSTDMESAHDALADIEATICIARELWKRFQADKLQQGMSNG